MTLSPRSVAARRLLPSFAPRFGRPFLIAGALLLCTLLLCALLLAPARARAQEADSPPSDGRALPASPRAFLLGTPTSESAAASARLGAERAARLGGQVAPPASNVLPEASHETDAGESRWRGPIGNARFPAWNLPLSTGERFVAYGNTSLGQIDAQFDDDGERVDLSNPIPLQQLGLVEIAALLGLDEETAASAANLFTTNVRVPGRIEGQVNTVNLNLGGLYNFLRTPFFQVGLGADFQAAQQNFSADRVTLNVANARGDVDFEDLEVLPEVDNVENGTVRDIAQELRDVDAALGDAIDLTIPPDEAIPNQIEQGDDREIESGFQAQVLTLFLQAQNPLLSARAGFQFDLGDEPDLAAGEREVSDRQNAVLLGLTGSYPATEALRVHGGVDGWFTLEGERDLPASVTLDGQEIEAREDVPYDEGNSYAAQIGADYTFLDRLSLGAALTYRYRTTGTLDGEDEVDSGYHLGIAPYVNYTPPGAPFSLYLKGGVRDEYREFSYSLLGENEFAPRAGATLGATYRF